MLREIEADGKIYEPKKSVRVNLSRKKRGEYKMTVPKSITFVKGCGSYKAGDGLQLDSADAATLVDAGFAVYREDHPRGE